jgi:hypothetical protein
MQLQSDLLSQQGLLEQQRINALADIARRESGVRSAYDSGALDASMERQYNTLQGQLAEQERARQEGIATVGQYYDDYARQLNQIEQMEAMGDYSQSYLKPYLTMARQEKMAGQAEAQAKAEQQEFENWLAMQRLRKTGSGGSSGGGGGTPSYKPTLTAAQARDAIANGVITQETVDAYNYYYGTDKTVDQYNRQSPTLNDLMGGMGAEIIQAQMNGQITPEQGQYLRMLEMANKFR